MQLNDSSKRKLIPLTLTCGLMASAFTFSYGSLGKNDIDSTISSSALERLAQQTNNYFYSNLSMKSQFEQRIQAWKGNTMFMSFAEQIVNEHNFKEIVSMGEDVVPYILEEIKKEPSPLVWSLNFIFGKTISNNPNTTIEQACKLWVKALS